MAKLKCFTIGHSTHTVEKFGELLAKNGVNCVIDVRTAPYSKYVPQYNKENIERELKKLNMIYLFMGAELGAMRKDPDLFFPGGGVDYARVRELESFKRGIERVIDGIDKGFRIALMCAEKDPLDCHRFILVTYALKQRGVEVSHILEDGGVISNDELEEQLLAKQKTNTEQPSLFDPPEKIRRFKEQALAEAYRERNLKITRKVEPAETE